VNVIIPFRADELQTTQYHRSLKMYEVIDGAACGNVVGAQFTHDGTTYTIDGYEQEERAHILAKLEVNWANYNPNNLQYLRNDWVFAQLLFWGVLDGRTRKGLYTRAALMEHLKAELPQDRPVCIYA
jgi:hypothetical protein